LLHNHRVSVASLRLLFTFAPERRSACHRNERSPSPEYPFRCAAVVEDDLKHFPLRDWADFVRGVAEKKAPMQKHLDQGCDSCKRTVRMFSALVEFAKQEVV
jgi:hypothetical protein